MSNGYKELTDEQAQHFLDKGHVVIKGAVSKELAREWRDFAYERLGYDPHDPATWESERIHMPSMNSAAVRDIAPRAHAAICDAVGGEDRLADPDFRWADGMIVNFSQGADRDWDPPSAEAGGWHKDGDWFKHFLDSPEQGLLIIVIWSDIKPQSGGTFVACDSVKPIAKFLVDRPEGCLPQDVHFGEHIGKCSDFAEITGEIGDVVIIHPFMLHASSQNPSGVPRFITNPAVRIKEPMSFNRENPADYSLVERGVLKALDVDSLDWQPTAERERVHPKREQIQRKMLEEQKARLAAAE
ncbi:MAG: hypothetical protein ABGY41_11420 [Candidatus Poribacteria bacterium]